MTSPTSALKRVRKRSWVGLDDSKPYAYLREAMVSGLMDGICSLDSDTFTCPPATISVPPQRQKIIWESLGTWSFSAHDYDEDELIVAAQLMLEHALSLEELKEFRLSGECVVNFLVSCRAAYNSFVPYHNFRHVVDVLQACFYFLLQLGTLPSMSVWPPGSEEMMTKPIEEGVPRPPIPALLTPFDALALLITAIGHDVGHPGVNNAFLVTLNAPLAQLYNDRSVLESFHCAAYSQILRRHWGRVFSDPEMRALMISCILATDMGLHFEYMKKLGWLQEKLHESVMSGGPEAADGGEGWNGRTRQEYRTLACSLLIKCADISNVARTFPTAYKWTMILTDEFSRQASMETDLGIPTALFAPPVRETIELGQSQIGFINIFAYPLFQGVVDVMPGMNFAVEELLRNKSEWEGRIRAEQMKNPPLERGIGSRRGRKDSEDDNNSKSAKPRNVDGVFSPRQLSLASENGGAGPSGLRGSSVDEEMKDDDGVKVTKPNFLPLTASGLRESTPYSRQQVATPSPKSPAGDPFDHCHMPIIAPPSSSNKSSTRSKSRSTKSSPSASQRDLARPSPPQSSHSNTSHKSREKWEDKPYESSTIPTGNPHMEHLEATATPPPHTVSGKMQTFVQQQQQQPRAVLEFPRPVSREMSSGTRPVSAPQERKECQVDGVDDTPSKHLLNGNGHGHSAHTVNGITPARITGHKQRPSTSSTPLSSHQHSSASLANGKMPTTKVSASASASLLTVPGAGSEDGTAGKTGAAGFVSSIKTLARKPSRRFRWWRKRSEDTPGAPVPVDDGSSN